MPLQFNSFVQMGDGYFESRNLDKQFKDVDPNFEKSGHCVRNIPKPNTVEDQAPKRTSRNVMANEKRPGKTKA
jgi:hypothetical protein